jgi:hypothetical protein
MFLRLVKKINKEMAESLRATKTKEKIIFNLKDAGFLLDDLEPHWVKIAKVFGKEGENIQAFGVFPQPKYGLLEEHSEIFYQKIKQQKGTKALDIIYGTINDGVFIKLVEHFSRHILFELGPLFSKNHYKNRFNRDLVLHDIALYFHNRRTLYKAVHSFFLNNKKDLSKIFGQPFVEDLIVLFSVDIKRKIPNFKVSTKATDARIMEKMVSSENYVFVGFARFYPKELNRVGYYHFDGTENELFLNNKDQLIINSRPRQAAVIGEEEKLEFESFVDKNLADWLKQTVSVIDFGAAIYEKVKTKIFLENI